MTKPETMPRVGPGRYQSTDGRWFAERLDAGGYRLWRQTTTEALPIDDEFPKIADVRAYVADREAGA